MRSDAGVGVDNPYKMQFAINLCGRLKVIWAAIAGGVCKLFGKRGVFTRQQVKKLVDLMDFMEMYFQIMLNLVSEYLKTQQEYAMKSLRQLVLNV